MDYGLYLANAAPIKAIYLRLKTNAKSASRSGQN